MNASKYRIGTKVEIKGGWPGIPDETVTIVHPPRYALPLPSCEWCIVKFADGGTLCVHQSRFAS